MSTSDDPYAERRKLTFEQAEGAAPLPSQLKRKEISQELRTWLWNVIYTHLDDATEYPSIGGSSYLRSPWEGIFRYMHVARDHALADEFKNDARSATTDSAPAVTMTLALSRTNSAAILGEAFGVSFGPTILDRDGATLDPTEFVQPLHKSGNPIPPG